MRIAISGASGRMGQMLVQAVCASTDLRLCAALDRPGAATIGQDAGAALGIKTGVRITDQLDALAQADCLIDFTRPQGTLAYLAACVQQRVACVIGTTGFDQTGKQAIAAASEKIGIVFAANMSVGVNATLKLLALAAKLLDQGYDVEVFEAHHRHKVDAPSGTAIAMGETIAQVWGKSLNDIADWSRHGVTAPRQDARIGFSSLRGGDIVGDHTVYFCGQGERLEITHRSSSRTTYAQGSLRAARFLADKPCGLYDMQDVLGAQTRAATQ